MANENFGRRCYLSETKKRDAYEIESTKHTLESLISTVENITTHKTKGNSSITDSLITNIWNEFVFRKISISGNLKLS